LGAPHQNRTPHPEQIPKQDQDVEEQMEAPAQNWKPTTQKSSSQLVMIASVLMLGAATALAVAFCLNTSCFGQMTQV
jgi:hypothetical protein